MLTLSTAAVAGQRTLTFTLPTEWADRVSVVGSFNDWTPGQLTLAGVGDRAEASVDLPADQTVVFRYLAEGDHWFDEPDADFVDGGGSVVLAEEVVDDPAEAAPAEAAPVEKTETVEPAARRPLSPAAKADKISQKRRAKDAKAAQKAADKARKKSQRQEDKRNRAAEKQRKAAERVTRERERTAQKQAEKAAQKQAKSQATKQAKSQATKQATKG